MYTVTLFDFSGPLAPRSAHKFSVERIPHFFLSKKKGTHTIVLIPEAAFYILTLYHTHEY